MGSDEDFFNTSWHFPLNYWVFIMESINHSFFSGLLSDGEILAYNFLSKLYEEDGVSEVRVITFFWMYPDKNFINSSLCFSLNYINYSSWFSKLWSYGENLYWDFLSEWSIEDESLEVRLSTLFWMCYYDNMFYFILSFLSSDSDFLISFQKSDQIFLVTPSVSCLLN